MRLCEISIIKKKMISYIFVCLLIFHGFFLIINYPISSTVSASPNPPVIDGGVTEFNGTWYIDSSENLVYINQTIILNGNLIINSSGSLSFYNVTLKMNGTSFGQNILVNFGGSMYIYDYDNNSDTTHDASVIMNGSLHYKYKIDVRSSNFTMRNSELHESLKFSIWSPDIRIENNYFFNNSYGIYIYNSNTVIINNNISNNDKYGIKITGNADNNIIINNTFINNEYAVFLDECGEKNIVKKNYFLSNVYATLFFRAKKNIISNNNYINNIYAVEVRNEVHPNKCDSNIITNNSFNRNRYGISLHSGGYNPKYCYDNVIINNTILNTKFRAISVTGFLRTRIENNTCNFNSQGILLGWKSSNNYVFNNTISSNSQAGILFSYSTHNLIRNNDLKSCGFFIRGDHEKFWTTHIIEITNKVNDDTIIYLKNKTSGNIINSVGQIILANCSNINIQNHNFDNNTAGIILGFTNNSIIRNNICSNSTYGISLSHSYNNDINNNTLIFNNNHGMNLDHSNKNQIFNNNISNNVNGLFFIDGSNATVHFNDIMQNTEMGINNTDPMVIINATDNWWGNRSGPYDQSDDRVSGGWYNPNGTGDNVSDYVKYQPWDIKNYQPKIEVADILTANEDKLYKRIYLASDLNNDNIDWLVSHNTSWLNWNGSNRTLYGIPQNTDVGSYWVCINITDGYEGYDEHNFTINVLNTPPTILTNDITIAFEDQVYINDYKSDDDGQGTISWKLRTDAKWLNFDKITGNLTGLPFNEHVGQWWVNITVNDGNGGQDSSNFTLTVLNENNPPQIITDDNLTAFEDEEYNVSYKALDIDLIHGDKLTWHLVSNTSFLTINNVNGRLSGIPSNDDVGIFWVNVTVEDENHGYDFTNFSLTILNVNDAPIITTEDVKKTQANTQFRVDYNASDIDSPLSKQSWTLITNASTWLSIDQYSGILMGTPTVNDIGWYNVNITVEDGDGGLDWHLFILEVIPLKVPFNEPPKITTIDKINITIGETYDIIYEATDDQTPIKSLIWSYNSNSSWLTFNRFTRVLNGIPTTDHVGWSWVNVTVSDGFGGYDWHNFTLIVLRKQKTTFPPELNNPLLTPTKGDADTEFTFSVEYYHPLGIQPDSIQIVINGNHYKMNLINSHYEYKSKLSEGLHTYYFIATSGNTTVKTGNFTTPNIDMDEGKDEKDDNSYMIYSIILITIIVIVFLILYLFLRKKKGTTSPIQESILMQETKPEPPQEQPQTQPKAEDISEPQQELHTIDEPIEEPNEMTEEQPQEEITPEQPEPQIQEQQIQQQEPIETNQEQPSPVVSPEQPQPTLETSEIEPESQSEPQQQPLTTLCPLCNNEIPDYSNPCPNCGGELVWGESN